MSTAPLGRPQGRHREWATMREPATPTLMQRETEVVAERQQVANTAYAMKMELSSYFEVGMRAPVIRFAARGISTRAFWASAIVTKRSKQTSSSRLGVS